MSIFSYSSVVLSSEFIFASFTTLFRDFVEFSCTRLNCFLGKTIIPKAANEVKLINSGKILENNKTVGQCKLPFGDAAGGIIIMHVVVQPSPAKTKPGKRGEETLACGLVINNWSEMITIFSFSFSFLS